MIWRLPSSVPLLKYESTLLGNGHKPHQSQINRKLRKYCTHVKHNIKLHSFNYTGNFFIFDCQLILSTGELPQRKRRQGYLTLIYQSKYGTRQMHFILIIKCTQFSSYAWEYQIDLHTLQQYIRCIFHQKIKSAFFTNQSKSMANVFHFNYKKYKLFILCTENDNSMFHQKIKSAKLFLFSRSFTIVTLKKNGRPGQNSPVMQI